MAIEEKDTRPTTVLPDNPNLERGFLTDFERGPNKDLARPFGTPNPALIVPVAVLTVLAILFFERVVDFGTLDTNWHITFGVNLVCGLLTIILGSVSLGPRISRSPRLLRNQQTMASLVLLVILAAFFLSNLVNLGTFDYTIDKLDANALAGLVCVAAMIVFTFRGSLLAIAVLVALFLWWGFSVRVSGFGPDSVNFGFSTIGDLFTSENGGKLVGHFFPPTWSYFANVIDPMLLTVQTAIAATVMGIVVALPLSILAARNTTPHPIIYSLVRLLINTIRAIPALILALLFIPFVGLGPGAGILGLAIHSVSTLTKLYAEAFESVKPQPIEALNAVGADGLKTFRWGVFPQAFPLVASYSIFNWESNGRDSTVVAFVGGGGIGFLLQANLSLLDYANVAVLLVVLILTVAALDRFSDFIRSRIL